MKNCINCKWKALDRIALNPASQQSHNILLAVFQWLLTPFPEYSELVSGFQRVIILYISFQSFFPSDAANEDNLTR